MELRLPGPGDPLLVILKLAGRACNINCYYCYEKRNHYADDAWMSPETLEKFLRACGTRPLRVVLHGGEPLLVGRQNMRALLEKLSAYRGQLELTMQTNGLLLTNAWIDLFDEFFPDIDIGVSIDGPEGANSYRVDYRDKPTFAATVKAIDLLHRRGKKSSLAITVTSLVLGEASATMDLVGGFHNVRAVRLSPCFDYDVVTLSFPKANAKSLLQLNGTGRGAAGWATSPQQYAVFVAECFDHWQSRYLGKFILEPVFSVLLHFLGADVTLTDWSGTKEPFIVTLYPDGSIGSSDEISVPDSTIGSVDDIEDLDEILHMQRNDRLAEAMRSQLGACTTCSHVAICSGGSLADRMRIAGTRWESEYCSSRRWLIDYLRERYDRATRAAA